MLLITEFMDGGDLHKAISRRQISWEKRRVPPAVPPRCAAAPCAACPHAGLGSQHACLMLQVLVVSQPGPQHGSALSQIYP